MEAGYEKIIKEPRDQKVPSEQKEEYFTSLLERAHENYFQMEKNVNWNKFQLDWNNHDSPESKEELLQLRTLWVEMKKNGEMFNEFIADKIRGLLDSKKGSEAYKYSQIYFSINESGNYKFIAEALQHKSVWGSMDGSLRHQLLKYIGASENQGAVEPILKYIENTLSPEYKRTAYLDNDIYYAAQTLGCILGEDKARDIFQELAEKDETFRGWFEKNKIAANIKSVFLLGHKEELKNEKFDLEKETARLAELQEEIEELKKHPQEKKQEEYFPADEEFPKDEELFQNKDYEREGYKSDKLYNFYGRFVPRLKESVDVNPENYLSGLFATVLNKRENKEEDYLNFICGKIHPKFAGAAETEIPELSDDDLYRAAAAAFSRALSLAYLEQKSEEAISETDILINYFETSVSDKSAEAASFFSEELRSLQKTILEKRGADAEPPESAKPFLIYHRKSGRSRQIPDYRVLLSEKIKWIMANEIINKPDFERFREISTQYRENLKLYKDVEDNDVPIYWEAKEKLEDFDLNRLAVFGRDGKYFFTALKASDFGFKEKELKYIVITRGMEKSAPQNDVVKYLQQNGVTLDFNFVDTGFRGSMPEMAIKYLASAGGFYFPQEEIDKRIKLLCSSHRKRGELSKKRMDADTLSSKIGLIEDRPQNIQSPETFIIDENGRLKPEAIPYSVEEQLKAWTVEHAIMRNFAPRLNPDKTIRYIQKNPMERYRFVEDYHGNYIGTHPLELWEYEDGRRVLVKGGPSHTLRADFVGQKFLKASGIIFTPETELINVDGKLKLKMEFLEGFREGGIELPKKYHNDERIQNGILIDALLGQYDRTAWNIMFNEEKDEVAFIDNGAGLFSRARGGHKGFPDHFDAKELEKILWNPQFSGKPVNEAYRNLVEVKDGKVIVKHKITMGEILRNFTGYINDDFIDATIEQAGFGDGSRSIEKLKKTIEKLIEELKNSSPDNDYEKTKEAIETYKKAVEAGGEASYLKQTIIKRRDDIVNLFRPLVY